MKKKKKIEIINENSYTMNKMLWIQCMKWLWEFIDKNMNIIIKKNYKSMKKKEELLLIFQSIERILQYCMNEMMNCMKYNWMMISFWLNESKIDKMSIKSFSTEYNKIMMK